MCGGDELRSKVSPICNEMHGLCPLYISVSKHEVCVDENHELVQKAGHWTAVELLVEAQVL